MKDYDCDHCRYVFSGACDRCGRCREHNWGRIASEQDGHMVDGCVRCGTPKPEEARRIDPMRDVILAMVVIAVMGLFAMVLK